MPPSWPSTELSGQARVENGLCLAEEVALYSSAYPKWPLEAGEEEEMVANLATCLDTASGGGGFGGGDGGQRHSKPGGGRI